MASTAVRLQRWFMEVGHWMTLNPLKLNTNKSELLWDRSRRGCPSLGNCGPTLQLGV